LQISFSEFNLNFKSDFIIVSLKDITEKYLVEQEKIRIFNEYIHTVTNLNIHILRFRLGEDGKYYITFSEGKNVEELGFSTAYYYGKTFEEFASNDNLQKSKSISIKHSKVKILNLYILLKKEDFSERFSF
jgi:hypothetical protein